MPIYAYKCATCGHADDVMQKMSDDALTKCPKCGAETYAKQLTAPGFALKGSGWYVTDFRGGNTAAGKPAAEASTDDKAASKTDVKADAAPAASATPATPTATPTVASPTTTSAT